MVISNVKEATDELIASVVDADASIITKEVDGDVEELSKQAYKLYSGGKLDYVILIPDDPMGASIYLNKSEGIRCVECRTRADVERAKSHDVNMIVLEDPDPERFNEVVGAVVQKGSGGFLGIRQRQQTQKPQPRHIEEPAKEKEIEKKHEDHAKEQQYTIQPRSKKKGFSESIKDYLGIIDDGKKS